MGIPWLIAMYLLPVYVVLHRFAEASVAAILVAMLTVVLYYIWYVQLENE